MRRPFRAAAPYYARYRPAYPAALIARLVEAVAVGPDARVLDLGCGPGTLAIPLASHAAEVVAVDVEPAMLEELRRTAPPNVTVVEARAEEVDEAFGTFALATAGRSFHWFDAPLVLDHLASITSVVALLGDHLGRSEPQKRTLAIAAELIDDPPIERSSFTYASLLGASPFSDVETISVEVDRSWTADELIGMAYSTSAASVERLGAKRAQFEERMRREFPGRYVERATVDAVVGRRPG